jgi:hypothetical protein
MILLGLFSLWELFSLTVLALAIIIAVINEADFIAGFLFVLTLVLCQWVFNIDIWWWVQNNPFKLLMFSVAYLLVGVIWSLFKWFRFVKSELEKCEQCKIQFLTSRNYPPTASIPSELSERWERVLEINGWPPKPSAHKVESARFIVTWPISVFWAIMRDFFVWVAEKAYSSVEALYQKISDRMFSSITKNK